MYKVKTEGHRVCFGQSGSLGPYLWSTEQEEHFFKSGPVCRCSLKATGPPETDKKLFGDRAPEQAEGLSSNYRTGSGCPQMSRLDWAYAHWISWLPGICHQL